MLFLFVATQLYVINKAKHNADVAMVYGKSNMADEWKKQRLFEF